MSKCIAVIISTVNRATYRLNNVMRVSAKRSRPRVRSGDLIVVRRRRLSRLGRVSGRVVGEFVRRVVTLVQAVVRAAVAQRTFFRTTRQLSIGQRAARGQLRFAFCRRYV